MISWFGMWVTRLTVIKFSQVAVTMLSATGNIRASAAFQNKVKDDVWKLLGKLPVGKNFSRGMAHKLTEGLKGMVSSSANLFEALKLRYFGPIDGHNVTKLTDTLKDLREIPGPKLLHIITV